ncbi:hypothetical protein CEXT_27641 [Caerostris extrusa]|uniref:Uncharacterized protein n=1 Tax=Caerostris extrusa TaxID=172846 RepID=A0AAV4UZ09_CAEEX|nr:hypothetical protein CEXT_27641 [Caerostris extrusa]
MSETVTLFRKRKKNIWNGNLFQHPLPPPYPLPHPTFRINTSRRRVIKGIPNSQEKNPPKRNSGKLLRNSESERCPVLFGQHSILTSGLFRSTKIRI